MNEYFSLCRDSVMIDWLQIEFSKWKKEEKKRNLKAVKATCYLEMVRAVANIIVLN